MNNKNRVIGSVIIVVGLYSVLWGKYKEEKQPMRELDEIPEAIKGTNNNNIPQMIGNVEEAEKCPSVAIQLPLTKPPTQ